MFFVYLSLVLSYIVPQNSYLLESVKNKPKVLFFTGGNSLMPNDIYSDFVSKLKDKYELINIKNGMTQKNVVMEQLFEIAGEEEIIPIGHSSGCTTLLNYCSKLKNVNKCILLDPVDNNIKEDSLKINFNSILQINAEKSYKWISDDFNILNPSSMIPQVPFIPAFRMDINKYIKLNDINVTKINVKDYGHCDILDTSFSNLMHSTIAKGNNDRDSINEYKKLLVDLIDTYIKNQDLQELQTDIEYQII